MWDVKYRPLKFSDVLGQDGSVQVLKARLRNGTALDTNFIFAGGHGQGKTTLARILARAILCTDINKDDPEPCNQCDNCRAILDETSTAFLELDAASQGSIDNIRSIVNDLPFVIFGASKRIYLFDEAHRMGVGAQDVLLKPLEEKKLVGIFCTTEPEKIRGTIRSRCESYTVRKITRDDILARMRMVLEKEGVPYEDDAVLIVIDYSGGHTRDVLNRLEMVAQMGSVSVENVRSYLRLSVISTYYEVLLALDDPAKAVRLIEYACEQVLPEDVAAGLAEAAMNSFRLANGMHADFVYVDRSLGQQVYQKYGANTIKLAEYFLRSRYVTHISLVCDVLAWAQSAGKLSVVPVMVPVSVVATPSSETASVAPATSVAPPVQVLSTPAPPTPVQAPVPDPSAPTPTPTNGKSRHAVVGNLGSDDPEALTGADTNFVRSILPRGHASQPHDRPQFSASEEDEESRVLHPEDWRRLFEQGWWDIFGRTG